MPSLHTSPVNEASIAKASPHHLIAMLYRGAEERMQMARQADPGSAERGEMLSSAVQILGGLRDSLSPQPGEELPYNLDRLYEYMQRRLVDAYENQSSQPIEEVLTLIEPLSSAWRDMDVK